MLYSFATAYYIKATNKDQHFLQLQQTMFLKIFRQIQVMQNC